MAARKVGSTASMAAIGRDEQSGGGIEYHVSINEEEDHPKVSGSPPHVFIALLPSEEMQENEDDAMKEEPINNNDKGLRYPTDARNPKAIYDATYGVAAHFSLASGQNHHLNDQQCASTVVNNDPKREEVTKGGILPTTHAIAPSNGRKSTLCPLIAEIDEKMADTQPVRYLVPPTVRKRGRPMGRSVAYTEEEMSADPAKRRLAMNQDAAHRYRERQKEKLKRLQEIEIQQSARNDHLKVEVEDMRRSVAKWRRHCHVEFGFNPVFHESAFESQSHLTSTSSSGIETTTGEYSTIIARNFCLRSQARQLYAEIINLRERMGFDGVETSADEDISSLLLNYINSTQS